MCARQIAQPASGQAQAAHEERALQVKPAPFILIQCVCLWKNEGDECPRHEIRKLIDSLLSDDCGGKQQRTGNNERDEVEKHPFSKTLSSRPGHSRLSCHFKLGCARRAQSMNISRYWGASSAQLNRCRTLSRLSAAASGVFWVGSANLSCSLRAPGFDK